MENKKYRNPQRIPPELSRESAVCSFCHTTLLLREFYRKKQRYAGIKKKQKNGDGLICNACYRKLSKKTRKINLINRHVKKIHDWASAVHKSAKMGATRKNEIWGDDITPEYIRALYHWQHRKCYLTGKALYIPDKTVHFDYQHTLVQWAKTLSKEKQANTPVLVRAEKSYKPWCLGNIILICACVAPLYALSRGVQPFKQQLALFSEYDIGKALPYATDLDPLCPNKNSFLADYDE